MTIFFSEAVAGTASKATGAGSVMTLISWLNSSNFGMWMGILIGVAGLAVNFYFKRKSDQRASSQHDKIMEMEDAFVHAEEEEQEEHQVRPPGCPMPAGLVCAFVVKPPMNGKKKEG